MNQSRQSSLPKPKDTRGAAQGGLPMLHMGRVTVTHKDRPCVDVMLDDLTMLTAVPVMCGQSGPDREAWDLPAPRSVVAVMYAWGSGIQPFVIGVFPRADKTIKPPAKGDYRRVFKNGTHMAVRKTGNVELGFADGTSLVVGDAAAPAEAFAGQKQESEDGDPFKQPADAAKGKPAPFQLTLTMADGSTLAFKDGSWNVRLVKDATIHAGENVTVEAVGNATVKGANVSVEATGNARLKGSHVTVDASLICDVKGLVVKLNGGSTPVARVGDSTMFGGAIVGPGNLTVLA